MAKVKQTKYIVAAAALAYSLVLLSISPTYTVPSHVQIQSSYSRTEAEFYYGKALSELRKAYWSGILEQVKKRQFHYAWKRLCDGRGVVYGIVTDPSSNVMAYIRGKNGEGYWITVLESREAYQFAGVHKLR